jgi:multicomponent Na+:H+ antiporter subunit D
VVLSGLLGAVFVGDLLNFYIISTVTFVAAYLLIIHNKDEEALKAGFKYLIMTLLGGFSLLLAAVLFYEVTGTYKMKALGDVEPYTIFFLLSFGLLVKAGAVPLHTWLPHAHSIAPSPISALLSGVMVKIGIYGLIRLYLSDQSTWMVLIGVVSMWVGAFLALKQQDIKRLLAYSTISQIGLILIGIGIGPGLWGGLFHVVTHGLAKGLLFLCAGAVIYATGRRKMEELRGLWRRMPITAVTSLVGALSILGLPPFSGFVSKSLIAQAGGVELKIAIGLGSALTFALFVKFMGIFFGQSLNLKVKEVPPSMLIPLVALALGSVIFGVFPNLLGFKDFWGKEFNFSMILDVILAVLVGSFLYRIRGFFMKAKLKLSLDRAYDSVASFLELLCLRFSDLYPKELNIYLSWVLLALILIFGTLIALR